MEVTSSYLTWSDRPEADLIGVSVFQRQNQYSLRFHIRTRHLDQVNNPRALTIRGSAQNGFILTPDSSAGVKPFQVAQSDLFYVMQTVTKFDLSKRERRTVWMRPEFDNGHVRIPPLPAAWIAAENDFLPGRRVKEEGARTMFVTREVTNVSERVSSRQAVLPFKPSSSPYQLPTNTDLTLLQTELAQKLEEARALVQQMERISGLRLVLDRNLRLVVNLTPLK